jgi:simple sugar transport system permease protein
MGKLKINFDIIIYLFMIVSSFTIFSILIPSNFLSVINLQSMAFQFPEFGILGLAMSIVMITGGIDLSIISTANLSSIIAAVFIKFLIMNYPEINTNLIFIIAIVVSLLIGLLCGLINGVLIALIGISPILATIGTLKLYEGISMVASNGEAIRNFPMSIQFIGNGIVGFIPFSLIIFILVAIFVIFFLQRSTLGFKIYMMGSNSDVALFSGLNNKSIIIKTYLISGFMASISGIIMMSRFNSAKVGYGESYLLQAVLVGILGGIDPAGGRGNAIGVIFGILTLQFLSSGFSIIGFTDYIRNVIFGVVLLFVMISKYIYSKAMIQES